MLALNFRVRSRIFAVDRHCSKLQASTSFGEEKDVRNRQIQRAELFFFSLCTSNTLIHVDELLVLLIAFNRTIIIYITLLLVGIFHIPMDFRFFFNFIGILPPPKIYLPLPTCSTKRKNFIFISMF